MSITIKEISVEEDEPWDRFVRHSNNGSIFHRLDFLDYHPDDRFDRRDLKFIYNEQNLVAVMPLAIVEEEDEIVATSPYGGSYGGLVVEESISFEESQEIVEMMLAHVRQYDVDSIVIRPYPREHHRVPSCDIEYHYYDKGFRYDDKEITNVLQLNRFDEDPFSVYSGDCRRSIRKARNSGINTVVDVEDEESLEAFHLLLTETLKRHDASPTHNREEFKTLFELFPERMRLSIAKSEGTIIAGVFQFLENDSVVHHFYNAHKLDYRNRYPIHLLLDREIRWAKQNDYKFFDFGASVKRFNPLMGIIQFKESFGTTGHFRNVYKFEF